MTSGTRCTYCAQAPHLISSLCCDWREGALFALSRFPLDGEEFTPANVGVLQVRLQFNLLFQQRFVSAAAETAREARRRVFPTTPSAAP